MGEMSPRLEIGSQDDVAVSCVALLILIQQDTYVPPECPVNVKKSIETALERVTSPERVQYPVILLGHLGTDSLSSYVWPGAGR